MRKTGLERSGKTREYSITNARLRITLEEEGGIITKNCIYGFRVGGGK